MGNTSSLSSPTENEHHLADYLQDPVILPPISSSKKRRTILYSKPRIKSVSSIFILIYVLAPIVLQHKDAGRGLSDDEETSASEYSASSDTDEPYISTPSIPKATDELYSIGMQ